MLDKQLSEVIVLGRSDISHLEQYEIRTLGDLLEADYQEMPKDLIARVLMGFVWVYEDFDTFKKSQIKKDAVARSVKDLQKILRRLDGFSNA